MVTNLETRMKNYENKIKLPEHLPVIVRIDGKAFHTLTRSMQKPFDSKFIELMNNVGTVLCKEVQNCRMVYIQSDEISLILHNKESNSQHYFGGKRDKINSVLATKLSLFFNRNKFCTTFNCNL